MADVASRLWTARLTGGHAAISAAERPADTGAAYAIQGAITVLSGARRVGWKLGATNAKALAALGLDEPFVGPLYDRFWHPAGATVALHPGHGPVLETEFLVVMGAALPAREAPYGAAEAAAAIESIVPAFEIVGCRLPEGLMQAGLMLIADGAANAAVVDGAAGGDWRSLDLGAQELRVSVNGEERARGNGSMLVWGGPVEAVAWLANHPLLDGRGLAAGERIMTGTCGGMIPIAAGDEAHADFGVLGEVRARFS